MESLGVYPVAAVTAVVAQSPGRVISFETVSPELLRAQLGELALTFVLAAAKTGMLGTVELVRVAAAFFEEHPRIPLVVDPVLRASAGPRLHEGGLLEEMRDRLLPRATLVTPNRAEAEALLGIIIDGPQAARDAATRLGETLGCAVLLKGGHLEETGGEVVDYLYDGRLLRELRAPRLDVPDLHGTGCTLSAAIAAYLARGSGLVEAVTRAASELRRRMANHLLWEKPRQVAALGPAKFAEEERDIPEVDGN